MKLVLVEFDDELREFLVEMFEAGHHQINAFKKIKEIETEDMENSDLFVLDWDHNPEEVGRFVLEKRRTSAHSPVILLCIDPPLDQRVLEACMDVYVKPNLSRLTRIAEGA
ncbi:MAG: hypothetical protein LW875_04750 [Proteobacteria bacterium]|jgi:DNA-binding response OmpR family regulator|nr:hypothetical protein [Pseudomonadota bacterium]